MLCPCVHSQSCLMSRAYAYAHVSCICLCLCLCPRLCLCLCLMSQYLDNAHLTCQRMSSRRISRFIQCVLTCCTTPTPTPKKKTTHMQATKKAIEEQLSTSAEYLRVPTSTYEYLIGTCLPKPRTYICMYSEVLRTSTPQTDKAADKKHNIQREDKEGYDMRTWDTRDTRDTTRGRVRHSRLLTIHHSPFTTIAEYSFFHHYSVRVRSIHEYSPLRVRSIHHRPYNTRSTPCIRCTPTVYHCTTIPPGG